jgi:hypothetical protein
MYSEYTKTNVFIWVVFHSGCLEHVKESKVSAYESQDKLSCKEHT